MNIVSSVMNPFNKSKLCRILIQDFPAIFESIDTLPLSETSENLAQQTSRLPPNGTHQIFWLLN